MNAATQMFTIFNADFNVGPQSWSIPVAYLRTGDIFWRRTWALRVPELWAVRQRVGGFRPVLEVRREAAAFWLCFAFWEEWHLTKKAPLAHLNVVLAWTAYKSDRYLQTTYFNVEIWFLCMKLFADYVLCAFPTLKNVIKFLHCADLKM